MALFYLNLEKDVDETTQPPSETNIVITQPTQDTASTYSRPNTDIRPSCAFGNKCYRKNPQHKVEEAHPEDNDYTVRHLKTP